MKANTTSKAREVLNKFLRRKQQHEHVGLEAIWERTITRADGTVERAVFGPNQMTKDGLNALASRGIEDSTSAFSHIVVGTQTAAASLGSVLSAIGEVERKGGAVAANSNEYMVCVATWAGNADGLTSVDLRSAGLVNHASSGNGTLFNHVNSVATILADSDFLNLKVQVRVGSHNL